MIRPISIQRVITGGPRTLHPTLVPQLWLHPTQEKELSPPLQTNEETPPISSEFVLGLHPRRQAAGPLIHYWLTHNQGQGKNARCGVYENKNDATFLRIIRYYAFLGRTALQQPHLRYETKDGTLLLILVRFLMDQNYSVQPL